MIVRTNNGYPSLTADGKIRECCCGCAKCTIEMLVSYDAHTVLNPAGNHKIFGQLQYDATLCDNIASNVVAETIAATVNGVGPLSSCTSAKCGESHVKKDGQYVFATFRNFAKSTGVLNTATFWCGYECNRTFTVQDEPPSITLRVNSVTFEGLEELGLTAYGIYEEVGSTVVDHAWSLGTITQDGTYTGELGRTVYEYGRPKTNTDLYFHLYFR